MGCSHLAIFYNMISVLKTLWETWSIIFKKNKILLQDEDTGKEVIYVTKPVKPTPRAYERKTHAMKPIYDSSKHHSG